jgi:hypothetical protein
VIRILNTNSCHPYDVQVINVKYGIKAEENHLKRPYSVLSRIWQTSETTGAVVKL